LGRKYSVFDITVYTNYSACHSYTLYYQTKPVCVTKHVFCVIPVVAKSLFLLS